MGGAGVHNVPLDVQKVLPGLREVRFAASQLGKAAPCQWIASHLLRQPSPAGGEPVVKL